MAARSDPVYDPQRDYSEYECSRVDAPFVTMSNARGRIGYKHNEAVRQLVLKGRLPARRVGSGYNAPLEIPDWALRGWMAYKGLHDRDQLPAVTATSESNARIRELEDALLVLRQAEEHERRARQFLEEALRESGKANNLLRDALGSVVIPRTPS